MKKEKPDGREQLFAYLYAVLGNPREAAVRAGYSPGAADETAAALLARTDMRRLIQKHARTNGGGSLTDIAIQGLLRLAFSPANDVVRLMLDDNGTEAIGSEELAGFDLFMVSELKRPKGGGWEVKLHDRAQALRLLLDHAASREQPEDGSFYRALRESAAAAAAEDDANAL